MLLFYQRFAACLLEQTTKVRLCKLNDIVTGAPNVNFWENICPEGARFEV